MFESFEWLEPLILFVLMILLVVLSAVAENAFSTLGLIRARHFAEEGDKRLESYVKSPNGYLLTIRIMEVVGVVGMIWTGYSLLGMIEFTQNDKDGMQRLALSDLTIWLILASIFFIARTVLGLGLSRGNERIVAGRLVFVLKPFYFCLRPLTAILELLMKHVLRKPEEKFRDSERIEEEFEVMLDESTRQGGLEDVKGRIMRSAIDYSDRAVREVMVPRTRMTACSVDATLDEALDLFVEEGYSRLPVYEKDIDTIVGILYFKDLVQKTVELKNNEAIRSQMTIRLLVRDAFFVPETKHIDDMFEEFKRKHVHIAIVIDEFGGTAGIITLEDIVEEFFGEIQDEYDSEEKGIVPLDKEEERVLVDASKGISEIGELFDVDLGESGEYESVGGLVTYRLGHLGTVGEEVDEAGLHFVVREANERCILRVEVSRNEET